MRKVSTAVLGVFVCGGLAVAQTPSTASGSKLSVELPGEPWALVFDAPGFKVNINGLQKDGRAYLEADNQSTGMALSVFLEKTSGKATEDECKTNQQRRLAQDVDYKREKIETKSQDGMAIVEYTIPRFQGVPVQQRNLFACLPKDDVYVDIHISKTLFKTGDEQPLNAVLNSAHFVASAPSQSAADASGENLAETSLDYVREGSLYFVQHDYAASIAPYKAALDAEKQKRTLPRNLWLVLVDNLSIAYGVTGDLNRAEETLNYGLSQDATYPIFYYNLACVAAGRNDENKTMDLLRKAFSYKSNVISGESMPDPRTDDSFKPFMADPRFQAFLKSL